jgi:thymidylate kinase
MLIVFSGTDGAGKSTQIDLIRINCEKNSKTVHHLWARGGYTPGFNYLKKLLRYMLWKKLPESGLSNNRNKMLKKKSVSSIWLTLAILDLILFYAIYVRGLSCLGRIVICDRYIEDTYLDFTYNFGKSFNENGFLWRLLVLLAPKPDAAFLLTVPVDVSQYRSMLKNEPFPDTLETLGWRLKMYMDETMFPSEKYQKIDCRQSIVSIQVKIKEKLEELT